MMERYPGDNCVDIIGRNEYNIGLNVASTLDSYTSCQLMTQDSLNRHKICGLFVCGMYDEKVKNISFYAEHVPALKESDGIHLSFVMWYIAMPISDEGEKNMCSFARRREMIKR